MSMNHLCGCTGVSASKLEIPKQREISNSCKICGGKPLTNGQGASPVSMFSSIGLEISGVIDPRLNWRTASKGKPRAVRRARTSFTNTIKRRPLEQAPQKNEDINNKERKKSREMPVSESEKLGVTILGQRFSDTIENVPIKKRRFLFRSPSPPPCPQFPGDESGQSSVSQIMSHQIGNAPSSNVREHLLKNKTGHRMALEDTSASDEKTNLDGIEEHLCDAADFSGISILAAAACNSSSVDDVMKTESLNSKQCSFKGDGSFETSKSGPGSENKITVEVPDILPVLDDKMGTPLVSISKLSGKGKDNAKVDSSSLEEDSSSSLPTVLNKDNGISGGGSLRDGRFHWDLNTVMEAWESPSDDVIMDYQPVASDLVGEDGTHGARVNKQECSEGKIVEGCSESVGKTIDKTVDALCNYKSENLVESNSSWHVSVADCDNNSAQKQLLGCPPGQVTDLVEQTTSLSNQGSSGFTKGIDCGFTKGIDCSLPGNASDPVKNSPSANSCPSEEHRTGTNGLGSESAFQTETTSHLHLNGSASTENLMCVPESNYSVDKTSNEIGFCEKAVVGSEVDLGKCSDDCVSADVKVSGAAQVGEAVFVCPVQDSSKLELDDCYVEPVGKKVSDIPVDGDLCKVAVDGELHGHVGLVEPFCEEKSDIICQSAGAENGICSSESFAFMSHGLSNHEENLGGCTTEVERVNLERGTLQGRQTPLTDQYGDDMESDHHIHIKSKDIRIPNVIDGFLLTDAPVDSDKGYKGNLVNSPVENALDDHFDCDYYSDASQNEQASAMEKVEQQGDDESQYEDGEFRESYVHSWEMDACDEGEAEHVDYGSDNREIDGFEAVSDYPASGIPSHIGSFESKSEGLVEDTHVKEDHNADGLKAEPRDLSSSVANVSDVGTTNKRSASLTKKGSGVSHSRRKYVGKKWEKSTKDATGSGAPTDKVVEDMELVVEGNATREQSRSASLRTKSSGWDRLPGSHKSSGDAVADTGVNTSDVKCDSVPEKLKAVGSTLRREPSSLIGMPKSPDILQAKDRVYFRGIRGRGDRWMESSSHQGPSRHDPPGYYGRAGFTHPGSKNAAAVSIAKVESNGFVVAPDGTVLEGSGAGHAGCLPRRSTNSSPNARRAFRRRGSPIERGETLSFNETRLDLGPRRDLSPGRHISIGRGRPGRYGSKIVSEGNMERYHGFTPDNSIGSSMPVQHSLSRRDRSFSPPTRPVQVSRSHTRSRSQSRTHSPHGWSSPRRSNLLSNGLRRRSRSPPEFRSEARVGRVRSPHGQTGFAENVTSFAPSPRNHASPPHPSRWIDERKDLIEHLRDNEYRRFSGRSPPKRLFSRSRRFTPVDSSGRLKPDEFYRPIHSGRFTEFSVGRASRPDDGNGDRRPVDRYEMPPSARQYDILGDVKQLRYETEEGFRLHNDCTKNTPEFPERGSPRSFDRGVANQLNNSPPRTKEEMGHFRYARDGKHKANYKTFEIRECDEDGTPRRRRHS